MTCFKGSTRNVLVDALICHQKVVDHPHFGSISLRSSRRILGFDSPRGRQPLPSWRDCLSFIQKDQ
jgi:hypothetical protein